MASMYPGQTVPSSNHGAPRYRGLSASADDLASQVDAPNYKPRPDFHRSISANIHYSGKKVTIPSYFYNIRQEIKLASGQKTTIVPKYTPRALGHNYQCSRLDHVEVLSRNGLTSSDIQKERRERNKMLAEELPRFNSALLNKCEEVKDLRNGKRDHDVAVSKLRSNNLQPEELEDARKTRNQSLQEKLDCRLSGVKSINDLENERKLKNESLSEIILKDDKLVSLQRILHEERQKANESLSENLQYRPKNYSEIVENKIINNQSLSEEQASVIEFNARRFQSRLELSKNRQSASVAALEDMHYPDFEENSQSRQLMNEKLHEIREQHLNEVSNCIPGIKQQAERRNKVAVSQLRADDDMANTMLSVKSKNNIILSEELYNDKSELQTLERTKKLRKARNCTLLDVAPASNLSDASEVRKARYKGVLEMLAQQTMGVDILVNEGGNNRRESNELMSEMLSKAEQFHPLSSCERNSLMLEKLALHEHPTGSESSRSGKLMEERKRRNQNLSKQTVTQDIHFEKAVMARQADLQSVQREMTDKADILNLSTDKIFKERNLSNEALKLHNQISEIDLTKAREKRQKDTEQLLSQTNAEKLELSEIDKQRLQMSIAAAEDMIHSVNGYNEDHVAMMLEERRKQKQLLAEQNDINFTF